MDLLSQTEPPGQATDSARSIEPLNGTPARTKRRTPPPPPSNRRQSTAETAPRPRTWVGDGSDFAALRSYLMMSQDGDEEER